MVSEPKQPTGTRRQQQKAETRALILDAARELFEEQGFDATTVREVAHRAGVGLGTIFSHFDDKGALLIAAVLDDLAETDRQILESLPQDASIHEQIMHVAAGGFGYWCRRPALSATLLREMWFIRGPSADQRRDETARFIEFGASLLTRAQKRGEIRDDVDLNTIAELLYSFYVGTILRAAADDRFDQQELLAAMHEFVGVLLGGIGSQR
jgi:AcrR family transcriptional regulator